MRIDAERPRARNRDRAINRAHVRSFLHAVAHVTPDANVETIAPPVNAYANRPYIFGQED